MVIPFSQFEDSLNSEKLQTEVKGGRMLTTNIITIHAIKSIPITYKKMHEV